MSYPSHKFIRKFAILIAPVFLFSTFSQTFAATITVDTNLDDGSAGNCELRDAILSANNNMAQDNCIAGEAAPVIDHVEFDPSLSGQTITLNGTQLPQITETVNINGDIDGDNSPDITIDANSASRALDINSENVNVQGLNFLNGSQAGDIGGTIAVRQNSILNLFNSSINNSTADLGGAIGTETDSYLHLNNVNINNSTATTAGGAIYVDKEVTNDSPFEALDLKIQNSNISNTSANNGGAIYVDENNESALYDTVIDHAEANQDGGGIYFAQMANPSLPHVRDIDMTNLTITNSKANMGGGNGKGGGMYFGKGLNSVSNGGLHLSDNEAQEGGSIYVDGDNIMGGMLSLGPNDYIANSSAYRGGGVFVNSFSQFLSYGANGTPVTLDHNFTSGGGGGAIYYAVNSLYSLIDYTDFLNNLALASHGGAIKTEEGNNITINNANFYQNFASFGGAIGLASSNPLLILNLLINNSNFAGNKATSAGGAIYLEENSNVTLNNVTTEVANYITPPLPINSNSAKYQGGFLHTHAATNSSLSINNSNISYNEAASCGALSLDYSNNIALTPISLINSLFTSNVAEKDMFGLYGDGGAICLTGGGISIDNTRFENNLADNFGGAAYFTNMGGQVLIDIINGSEFINNALTAKGGLLNPTKGGHIFLQANGVETGILNISDSIFDLSNAVAYYGGGVYGEGNTVIMNVLDSIFDNNFGGMDVNEAGGIAAYNNAELNIDNSLFQNLFANTAAAIGGHSSITYLSNSTVTNNNAIQAGGVGIMGVSGMLNIDNSAITQNIASFAGGVGAIDGGILNITNSYIGENQADMGGGIGVATGARLSLINSTIHNNLATNFGGGVFLMMADIIDILSSTIAFNHSDLNGGGISYIDGIIPPFTPADPINMQNTILEGNTATASGPDCMGASPFSTGQNNLISDTTDCGGVFQPTDILDVSAQLGALGLNGGDTLNFPLLANSPAINTGNTPILNDQRGVARPQGPTSDIGSYEYEDHTAPIIAEVTPVTSPTNNNTPAYTFSSDEAGTITYGGACSSTTVNAINGNNNINFNFLAPGTYSNCTIQVTDSFGNISNLINVTPFTITSSGGSNGGGSGGGGGSPQFGQGPSEGGIPFNPEPEVPNIPAEPENPNIPIEPELPNPNPETPHIPVQPENPTNIPTDIGGPDYTEYPSLPEPTEDIEDVEEIEQDNIREEEESFDLSSISDLIRTPEEYQNSKFSRYGSSCRLEEFAQKYGLTIEAIWQDGDNDGLSDYLECAINTDPTVRDTDGDGRNDNYELLNIFTDPILIDQFNPENLGDFVIVTLPEDSLVTANESPVFLGLSRPNEKVKVYIFESKDFDFYRNLIKKAVQELEDLTKEEQDDLYTKKFSNLVASILQKYLNNSLDSENPEEIKFLDKVKYIGQAQTDQNGVFLLDSSLDLRDNKYLVLGITDQSYSLPVEFTVDQTLSFMTPKAQKLGGQAITEDILSGKSKLKLESNNNKPVLTGKVTVPSKVVAIWQSNITGSALLTDSLDQEFRLTPPEILETGEHTVYLTAYRNSDNAQSKTQKISFIIKEKEMPINLPIWLFILIGAGIIGGVAYFIMRGKDKKEEVVGE